MGVDNDIQSLLAQLLGVNDPSQRTEIMGRIDALKRTTEGRRAAEDQLDRVRRESDQGPPEKKG